MTPQEVKASVHELSFRHNVQPGWLSKHIEILREKYKPLCVRIGWKENPIVTRLLKLKYHQ